MIKRQMAAIGVGLMFLSRSAMAADAPADKVEPNVCKGRVTTSDGKPLAGATVHLRNTVFIADIEIKTDADGRYRTELAKGVWHVRATVTKTYHKLKYEFDLEPQKTDDVPGPDGGIRDFVWKLSGDKPDPDLGTYGSPVIADLVPGDFDFELKNVELTLTPDGPLVDGSKGEVITAKLKHSPDGWCIPDVPVGRYKITARLAPKGGKPEPLQVRPRGQDADFEDTLTTDFIHVGPLTNIHKMDLEVQKAGKKS